MNYNKQNILDLNLGDNNDNIPQGITDPDIREFYNKYFDIMKIHEILGTEEQVQKRLNAIFFTLESGNTFEDFSNYLSEELETSIEIFRNKFYNLFNQ